MDGVAGMVSHESGGRAFTWTLALSTQYCGMLGRLGRVYDMELANIYRSIFSTPTHGGCKGAPMRSHLLTLNFRALAAR